MDTDQRVCDRDGAPTRLCCAECEAAICPACSVRTPVGFKCQDCAGDRAPTTSHSRARLLLPAAAVLLAVALGLHLFGGGGGDAPAPDPVAVDTGPSVSQESQQAALGEEARDGQLLFVVDDIACDGVPADAPTAKRCTLRFRVRNDSRGPATLLARFQYLVDGSKIYGADMTLSGAQPENAGRSLSELNINPDVVVPLVFVYDLPPNVEPTEAQFKGTGSSRFGVNVRLQRRA